MNTEQPVLQNFKPSPRDFNLMLIGQIISILGSALLRFALSMYVLDMTGRSDIFAALYAISNVPLLLAPLGGAIADRFNRRNLMVIFDFSSSAIVLFFLFMLLGGTPSIPLIGTVMVLLAVISALYTPAVTASIPLLVESEKLEGANGLVQAVQALSSVVGPIMGGILYGVLGVHFLVAMSCAAFFGSAVMEIFIRIPFVKRAQEGGIVPTIAKDLKDGFTYVIKETFICKCMILAALLNLLLTPYFVVGSPIILRVTMGSSETMCGIGLGLINAATILGALSIGALAKKISLPKLYRWILLIAVLMLPMALAVTPTLLNLGYYPSFLLFVLCAIPVAMIMTIISIFVITKVQKKTPNENLGKVMAIITAVSQCVAPVGQLLYGFIFEAFSWGVYLPTLFVSLAMVALALFGKRVLRNEGDAEDVLSHVEKGYPAQ